MWNLETINAINQQAAFVAKRLKKKPVLVKDGMNIKGLPHLGRLCKDFDEKYKRIATLFVDISGFGSPGEDALTQEQCIKQFDKLIQMHGPVLAAIEEIGPFQGYVAVWSTTKEEK